MEKKKSNSWVYILCDAFPLLALGCIIVISMVIALIPPKVSEWKKVIVVSRSEIIVPYKRSSETEVSLVFSDGTTWKGSPSTAKSEQQHLLHAQKGDVECYRYNSHYFGGKQWK